MTVLYEIGTLDIIEGKRLATQHQLDYVKTQAERNKLGQFATPTALATDLLKYAKTLISPRQEIRFLDPAFGTGSFFTALLRSFPLSQITMALGYEMDPHYGQEAIKLWEGSPLKLNLLDFTRIAPPESDNNKANLFICNPPYVRHHHLSTEEKLRLQMVTEQRTGIKMSGLAGLYGYFLLISHDWLANGGLAGWLIPSEFMDVNYGKQIKQYLSEHVTLLRIHRFNPDNVQFKDAYVSSAVVWFKKEKPPIEHEVECSYGGTLTNPETSAHIPAGVLRRAAKWTAFPRPYNKPLHNIEVKTNRIKIKLLDLFKIKRGIATGANKFFILTYEQTLKHQLPSEFLIPILPSPRYLLTSEIEANAKGNPILDQQLFLLDCRLPENDVKTRYPSLWEYIQNGVQKGIDKCYLCNHRSPWYSQENRPPAPFLCTYMGRKSSKNNKPFRFILNHSKAVAPNVYLMLYPKPALERELKGRPELLKAVWQALNEIPPDILIGEGRVYGGGLYKIEPKELANAPADNFSSILPNLSFNRPKQLSLFDYGWSKK